MSRLPTTVASITTDWMTQSLRASGAINASTTVASLTPHNMGAGVGFMGEVGRLGVTYTGGSGPESVICKIPTQDPMIRGMLAPARVFEREARFYSEIAPQLRTVPSAHYVAADYANDDYVLVLQDLGHLRVGDQSAGVTATDAAAVMRTVAGMHAHFWQTTELNSFDWLPMANSDGMKIGSEVYKASLPGFMQVFEHAIDADMIPVMEQYGANVHQLLDRIAAMPNTVAHFDFRLDNLFFGDSGDVWMIDFQTCSKGGGAYDVAYFMSQSVSTAVRQANEDSLLHIYHDELIKNGVKNYAFEQFFQDYRVGVLYGWIIPVFAVGSLDVSSERAMTLWTEVVKRAQSAMRDHRVSEFLI